MRTRFDCGLGFGFGFGKCLRQNRKSLDSNVQVAFDSFWISLRDCESEICCSVSAKDLFRARLHETWQISKQTTTSHFHLELAIFDFKSEINPLKANSRRRFQEFDIFALILKDFQLNVSYVIHFWSFCLTLALFKREINRNVRAVQSLRIGSFQRRNSQLFGRSRMSAYSFVEVWKANRFAFLFFI